jgi:hypothetical protein
MNPITSDLSGLNSVQTSDTCVDEKFGPHNIPIPSESDDDEVSTPQGSETSGTDVILALMSLMKFKKKQQAVYKTIADAIDAEYRSFVERQNAERLELAESGKRRKEAAAAERDRIVEEFRSSQGTAKKEKQESRNLQKQQKQAISDIKSRLKDLSLKCDTRVSDIIHQLKTLKTNFTTNEMTSKDASEMATVVYDRKNAVLTMLSDMVDHVIPNMIKEAGFDTAPDDVVKFKEKVRVDIIRVTMFFSDINKEVLDYISKTALAEKTKPAKKPAAGNTPPKVSRTETVKINLRNPYARECVFRKILSRGFETLCPLCKWNTICLGTTDGFDIGHIKSKRDGGKDELDNLLPICSKCNTAMRCMHMSRWTHTFHQASYIELVEAKKLPAIEDLDD